MKDRVAVLDFIEGMGEGGRGTGKSDSETENGTSDEIPVCRSPIPRPPSPVSLNNYRRTIPSSSALAPPLADAFGLRMSLIS